MSETIGQRHTNMEHTTKYAWSYSRTNSKGEAKFRHTTNESVEDVIAYLEEQGIDFKYMERGSMLWIYCEKGVYAYYYTTGRWAPKTRGLPTKHYVATGIKDFLERFMLAEANDKPDFEKLKTDIYDMILKDIKEAGAEGTIQKKINDKYEDLTEWQKDVIRGSFARLKENGSIFCNGDKEGRSKIMRHKMYKENISNETH